MKKFLKLFFLNTLLISAAVILYNGLGILPGLSVISTILFFITCPAIVSGMIFGNRRILLQRTPKSIKKLLPPPDVDNSLRPRLHSPYFGALAKTATDQSKRAISSADKALAAINQRFGETIITAERYRSVILSGFEAISANLAQISERFRLLDDAEYRRLKSTWHNAIPMPVRQQQLALYNHNTGTITNAISMNENLILKMNVLTTQIIDSKSEDDANAQSVADEITELTKQIQLYR